MKRTQLILDGTRFDVYPENEFLIQVSNPDNKISFESLKEEDGYYALTYDPLQKNSIKGFVQSGTMEIKRLIIMSELLLPGFAPGPGYNEEVNELSYKHNWNVLLLDDVIKQRLKGKPVELDIAGVTYLVDIKHSQLVNKKNPKLLIDMKAMRVSSDCEFYTCFFDPATMKITDSIFTATPDPAKTCYLEIPYDIDPIGQAIRLGIEPTTFLPKCQQMAKQVAQLKPIAMMTSKELERAKVLHVVKKQVKGRNKGKKI